MCLSRDEGHEDADLAVVDLAEPAAPLTRHADRLGPLLDERRGVENDHRVGRAEGLADLAGEGVEQRRVVPRYEPDELLQGLPLLVMEGGDRLAGFAFELGQKARHVLGDMSPLFRRAQRLRERLDEGLEPFQKAPHRLGGNFRLGQHLLQSHLVAPLHDRLPSGRTRHGKP